MKKLTPKQAEKESKKFARAAENRAKEMTASALKQAGVSNAHAAGCAIQLAVLFSLVGVGLAVWPELVSTFRAERVHPRTLRKRRARHKLHRDGQQAGIVKPRKMGHSPYGGEKMEKVACME